MISARCSPLLHLLLTGMVLAASAVESDAQRVQPMDVWLACKSPEALDAAEIRSVPDARITAKPKLRYLCREMEVPADLRSWRPVAAKWNAALNSTEPIIPTPAEIAEIAAGALEKLQSFNDRKARVAENAKWSRLARIAVYFGPGETAVPPEDSITVREFAELVREFQARFPGRPLTVLGSTDPEGDSLTNRRIATARAVNLKIAIVRHGGIDESLLEPAAEVVRRNLSSTIYQLDRATPHRDSVPVTRATRRPGGAGARQALNPTFRTGTIAVETTVTGDAALSSSAQQGFAAGSGGSRATPNWAVVVTDVIIERAKADLTAYLIGEAAYAICSNSRWKPLFPTVCALVATGNAYQPTASMLRVAVASDVGVLFKRAFAVQVGPTATFERAVAANIVSYSVDLVSGKSVEELLPAFLGNLADKLEPRSEIRGIVWSTAEFARSYSAAKTEIPAAGSTEARYEAVGAALRAVAVSIAHADSDVKPPPFLTLSAQASAVVAGFAAWDEAVKSVREARTASAEVRLRAVSEALSTGIDALFAALPIAHATSDIDPSAPRIPSWSAPIRELVTAYVRGDYRTAFSQGVRFLALTGDTLQTNYRLAAFVVEFATADDESSMRQALRQFINQGGGYQMKRSGEVRPPRRFTTLNAYVGIAGGREWTVGSGGKSSNQGAAMLGLGLEHGWRIGPDDTRRREQPLRPRSFSVFLQVMDLGAIAAARIKDDEVDVPPARLTQVLSPGLYGIWSIGRSPLAVGIGAAFAPDARIATDPVTSKERSLSAVRASLFLAGDVPLFP
jgi:outer membrane protein OmpA-like peptidoglycan-associated protein